MAGSEEFQEELSRAAQNKATREEIGNDPERMSARLSGVDREAYDFDGFTDKEINMALQGGSFGDKDYARLTGETPGDDDVSIPTPVEDNPGTPDVVIDDPPAIGTPEPEPTPGPTQGINPGSSFGKGPFSQNINQDNDITSSVTGSNNTVTNNQDNSINGYAGDAQGFSNDYIRRFTNRFS